LKLPGNIIPGVMSVIISNAGNDTYSTTAAAAYHCHDAMKTHKLQECIHKMKLLSWYGAMMKQHVITQKMTPRRGGAAA